MLYLDTTQKALGISLVAAPALNQLNFACVSATISNGIVTYSSTNGKTQGLNFVTTVPAPSQGHTARLEYLSVTNNDTSPATVIVQMLSGISSTGSEFNKRNVFQAVLGVGYSMIYDKETGFKVYDNSGARQYSF